MKVLVAGDAMIPGKEMGAVAENYFGKYGAKKVMDWETKDKAEAGGVLCS